MNRHPLERWKGRAAQEMLHPLGAGVRVDVGAEVHDERVRDRARDRLDVEDRASPDEGDTHRGGRGDGRARGELESQRVTALYHLDTQRLEPLADRRIEHRAGPRGGVIHVFCKYAMTGSDLGVPDGAGHGVGRTDEEGLGSALRSRFRPRRQAAGVTGREREARIDAVRGDSAPPVKEIVDEVGHVGSDGYPDMIVWQGVHVCENLSSAEARGDLRYADGLVRRVLELDVVHPRKRVAAEEGHTKKKENEPKHSAPMVHLAPSIPMAGLGAQELQELKEGLMVTPTVRLVAPLGQGGMGSVWLADHLSLRTRVVVKFMSGVLASSDDAKARFAREASAAAQVKSPHVVHMLDHGVAASGAPYIVMEYLEGKQKILSLM